MRREKGITQTEDGRETLFDVLLEPNPDKGYEVPKIEELVDEAFLFLVAGSDTTAYSIACTTFYLLTDKERLTKLRKELKLLPRASDGHLDLANVMGLPYLVLISSSFSFLVTFFFFDVFAAYFRLTELKTAVVKEGLRLSSGVPGILPRVVPPEGAYVKNEFIPGGVRALDPMPP